MRPRELLVAGAIACSVAGCAASSANQVSENSIVSLPSGTNLLSSAGSRILGGGWHVSAPAGVALQNVPDGGLGGVSISRTRPGARGAIIVSTQLPYVPSAAPGTTYTLTARIRAVRVSRSVRTEVRLEYEGGGYSFFGASRFGIIGVAGTTPGWVTVRAVARAGLKVTGVTVFLVDSLPTPRFSGLVEIEAPRLVVGRRGAT